MHSHVYAHIFLDGDPSLEFSAEWVEAWMRTDNYRMFDKFTGASSNNPPHLVHSS